MGPHGASSPPLPVSAPDHQFSKTVRSPVVSMPDALAIYRRLVRYKHGKGYGLYGDFLFFPKYRNRDVALPHLRLQSQVALARIVLARA